MPIDPTRLRHGRRLPLFSAATAGRVIGAASILLTLCAVPARSDAAHAYLVFDARTGEVLDRHNAFQAWYPASVTKLMTTYVTFQALKAGRLKLSSPVVMSPEANSQPPSKMGFPTGTVLTVDNALKMVMVKSANDVAWALGEAVGGSKDAFVAEMNAQARRLGMNRTVWANPNGLPDPAQYTNAHDLGLLARALIREFPEYAGYFSLPGIQFGKRVIRNHNHLMDRYPGTDGMKTGFICSGGFNVVATVTRGDKRLVAVVLGSPNARVRAEKAAELFTKAFDGSGGLMTMFSSREQIDAMAAGPEAAMPPLDIREEVCGKNRRQVGEDADDLAAAPPPTPEDQGRIIIAGQGTPKRGASGQAGSWLTARFDIGAPVKVWTGGADAAPPAGANAIATAKTPAGAGSNVAALVAPTRQPPPGAIFPGGSGQDQAAPPEGQSTTARAFNLFSNTPPGAIPKPATGPASGAGLDAVLPPANGTPMVIAGQGGATAPGAARRGAEPIAAVDLPLPERKPKLAAAKPAAKTAHAAETKPVDPRRKKK